MFNLKDQIDYVDEIVKVQTDYVHETFAITRRRSSVMSVKPNNDYDNNHINDEHKNRTCWQFMRHYCVAITTPNTTNNTSSSVKSNREPLLASQSLKARMEKEHARKMSQRSCSKTKSASTQTTNECEKRFNSLPKRFTKSHSDSTLTMSNLTETNTICSVFVPPSKDGIIKHSEHAFPTFRAGCCYLNLMLDCVRHVARTQLTKCPSIIEAYGFCKENNISTTRKLPIMVNNSGHSDTIHVQCNALDATSVTDTLNLHNSNFRVF